jgi:hypothetical protein
MRRALCLDGTDLIQRAALLRALARSAAGGKIPKLDLLFQRLARVIRRRAALLRARRAAPPLLVKTGARRARDLPARAAVAL